MRLSYVPALRCAPCRTSYEPYADATRSPSRCAAPMSLRSSGGFLVLPAVVLYAHCGLCLTCRRLRALVLWWGVKVKVKCASGGPAQRAGGRCPAAVPGGWLGPVGCSLRLSPEATRNLPGVQPAMVWRGAGVRFRRLHSRQNHWLGFAGQAKGAPDLEGKLCAALSPGTRPARLPM